MVRWWIFLALRNPELMLFWKIHRKKLNLDILGSKIEISAQNSNFLRKQSPHITLKISELKQPMDNRTRWLKSPWMVLSTCKGQKNRSDQSRTAARTYRFRRETTGSIVAGLMILQDFDFWSHDAVFACLQSFDVQNPYQQSHDEGWFFKTSTCLN